MRVDMIGRACGTCRSSPCDGFCDDPDSVAQGEDGFRAESFGTDAQCFEVMGYVPTETSPRIVCWESGSRTLRVNGETVPCLTDEGYPLEPHPQGAYCVQVSAGDPPHAGFLLPTR